MKMVLFLVLVFPWIGFSQVEFSWVESLDDDFSFVQEWEYAEGIYVNQWGQLSCDGFCPEEVDRMKDDEGRIIDDSLTAFYTYVDTTHRYFTHEGVVRAYEFGECHYAQGREENGVIIVDTEVNMSSHTSLHMELDSNPESKLRPKVWISFNSIRSSTGPIKFNALRGKIEIAKSAYDDGILQMRFDLEFQHMSNDQDGPQTWNGKILVALPQ